MLVKEPAGHPEFDKDDSSREMLLREERNENALPSVSPPQKAVLLCPVPGELCHMKWWLMKWVY